MIGSAAADVERRVGPTLAYDPRPAALIAETA
jgi:hypothetical protein